MSILGGEVTLYSERMGNTFGPNGFSIGSRRHVFVVKREMVRSMDGRWFDMASYRNRSGSAVASTTQWTSWQTQINGRM
jgi:hypothetical protein